MLAAAATVLFAGAFFLITAHAQPAPQIVGGTHYRCARTVAGWLPPWMDVNGSGAGWAAVQANAGTIDEVSFFAFDADPKTGDLAEPGKGMDDASLAQQVSWLHTREVAALFTVTQFNHVHDMLSDPVRLDHLIDNIVAVSNRYGFDGVDIDFEDFKTKDPQDAVRYTDFVSKLSQAMHAQTDFFDFPKVAIATVLGRTERGSFSYTDYGALAESGLDRIRVMAYDDHVPASASAGAGAPLPWYGQVADFIKASGGPQWKFALGIPAYAYKWPVVSQADWTATRRGSSVTYLQAMGLMADHKAARLWDASSGTPYLTYKTAYVTPTVSMSPSTPTIGQRQALPLPQNGQAGTEAKQNAKVDPPATPEFTTWIAYYEDAQSWKMKVQTVLLASHLNGLTEWALGDEDPAVWPMLNHALAPQYPIYGAIGLCYWRFGGGARMGDVLGPEHSTGIAQSGTLDGYAGREQDFEYARLYYEWGRPRAYLLDGDLLNAYLSAGGPSGPLGFPLSDPQHGADGKLYVTCEHGVLTPAPPAELAPG